MIDGEATDAKAVTESMTSPATAGALTKPQWRTRLLAARRARSAADRTHAADAVSQHLLAELTGPRRPDGVGWSRGVGAGRPGGPTEGHRALTVCAFLPLPSEPLAADLPYRLAATGARVLVPVARPGAALDWCELGGRTRPGMLGVAEPAGARLGPAAIRAADVVLVPALAVDGDGFRLGRGGGHYDRTLALLADSAARPRLIAVVFDEEVVHDLPRETHDVPVTDVATPSGGVRRVAPNGRAGASSD